MLREFVAVNRQEILARARARVSARNAPVATEIELSQGLPVFLNQLGEALRKAHVHEVVDHEEIQLSASPHGHDLITQGLTVAQVVHDYGELRIGDLSGKGCIFTIDLPKQPPPSTSIRARVQKATDGPQGAAAGGGTARSALAERGEGALQGSAK